MYRLESQRIRLRRGFFRSSLLGLAGLASFTLTLVLHVLVVNTEGLVDLSAKSFIVIETKD